MAECTGKHFILNGELTSVAKFDESLVYHGESIYEVIRLIKGIPLFFTEHCERLDNSFYLQRRVKLQNSQELKRDILLLTESENSGNINIKIVFNFNRSSNYLIYQIPSTYPSDKQIIKGVRGTIFEAERTDPESKTVSRKLREVINDHLLIENSYEAILINKEGYITEGSRSNIFLLNGDELFTAPDNSVLNGITRKQIINICSEMRIPVIYALVHKNQLSDFKTVFMTGTSPGILPFCSIDKIKLNPENKLLPLLRLYYNNKMEESLIRFKTG
jgi:branched-chain amino acid aminotransferase